MPMLQESVHIPWHGCDLSAQNRRVVPLEEKRKPSSLSVKEKKCVHFSAKLYMLGVTRRQDFTPEETRKMWMDSFDRINNRRDVYNTVYLMRSGLGEKLTEEDYFCARGLEKFSDDANEHQKNRKRSIGVALSIQRVLRKSGISNPEMIAKAYHKYTIQSKYIAYRKGIRDREAVDGVKSCSSPRKTYKSPK